MKKLQRLVLSGLLVFALAFGLAGCGSNSSTSKSSLSKDKVSKVVKQKSNKDKQSSKKSNSDNESQQASNAITNDDDSSSSSSNQASSQKQLGLGDVAVWTDENGITHHVDSDGMDRQTSSSQSGVTYKDWSGNLPSNAQIIKGN